MSAVTSFARRHRAAVATAGVLMALPVVAVMLLVAIGSGQPPGPGLPVPAGEVAVGLWPAAAMFLAGAAVIPVIAVRDRRRERQVRSADPCGPAAL